MVFSFLRANKPAEISGMLADDTRLLRQGQMTWLLTGEQAAWTSACLAPVPLISVPLRCCKEEQRSLHTQGLVLQEWRPKFKETIFDTQNKHAFLCSYEDSVFFFQHYWKDSPEQRQLVFFPTKHAEMLKIHEALPFNTHDLTMSLLHGMASLRSCWLVFKYLIGFSFRTL